MESIREAKEALDDAIVRNDDCVVLIGLLEDALKRDATINRAGQADMTRLSAAWRREDPEDYAEWVKEYSASVTDLYKNAQKLSVVIAGMLVAIEKVAKESQINHSLN